jgi:hypothetical protein
MDKFSKGCVGGCLTTIVILLFGFIVFSVFQEEKELTPEELIENQFSQTDGRHYELVFFVEDRLNDPESFEHVMTKHEVKDDHILIQMDYRAKNKLNAMVLEQITAKADKTSGKIIEVVEVR